MRLTHIKRQYKQFSFTKQLVFIIIKKKTISFFYFCFPMYFCCPTFSPYNMNFFIKYIPYVTFYIVLKILLTFHLTLKLPLMLCYVLKMPFDFIFLFKNPPNIFFVKKSLKIPMILILVSKNTN